MELQFFCRDCGSAHAEPADARLGHLVPCLDCALPREDDDARSTGVFGAEVSLAA